MTSAPHYVTLILESFDVGCETGSSFQVQFTLGSLKKFCNYDKRIGTIASIDLSLTIRFRLNRISGSLIEQFSAVYHTNTQNSVDVSFTEGTGTKLNFLYLFFLQLPFRYLFTIFSEFFFCNITL